MRVLSGLWLAVGAGAVASCAAAQPLTTYRNVDAIVVKDFIGTVTIDVSDEASAALTVAKGEDDAYPVITDKDGTVLSVRSDENPDRTRWRRDVQWRLHKDRAFEKFLEDYPTLAFSVPPGTAVSFDSAVVSLDAGDVGGAFSVRGGHVDGEIGDVAEAEIGIHGSADLIVGDVAQRLDISIHGSGDFEAGEAARLIARIHGSGDITLGDVASDADTSIHGSGDIELGKVGGAFTLDSHGSGDVEVGPVGDGAEIEIFGSSGVSIDDIAGETEVAINGSGDVRIDGGRAENLRVRIRGSGDFDLDGVAVNPDVSVHGSGDIRIRRHEGTLYARGDGDIRIGRVRYGDDD